MLYSPVRAPIGGPDILRSNESVGNVLDLVSNALLSFKERGIQRVALVTRPAYYGPQEAAVLFALFANGFRVDGCDLSYGIRIQNFSDVDDYVQRLGSPARRAVKHSFDEEFLLREASGEADWKLGWSVLSANRAAKDRRLSMKFAHVWGMSQRLPGKMTMYIENHSGHPCAAALVYSITPRHQYVVYWGDAMHNLPRSPMNRLVHDLVALGINQGKHLIDVGTSTADWRPNDGLIRFKTSVGAEAAPRFSLSVEL